MDADVTSHALRGLWRLGEWPTRRAVLLILALGLVVLIPGGLITESRFAATGYPGGGFGGPPLTLDPAQRRAEYDSLADRGTLDDFRRVQATDVGIIVGTALVFPTVAILAARRHPSRSRWHRAGLVAAAVLATAPIMDALENVTLVSMLTDPARFPNWLGWLNSGFSLAKAALFVGGGLLLLATAASSLRLSPRPSGVRS
jgi:hypothetical protein